MEIERKFLISKENLPADLNSYPHHRLEQGYLSTAPTSGISTKKVFDHYNIKWTANSDVNILCVTSRFS